MRKDLKGKENMDPIVGMLYAMVDENYKRLQSIVAGMTVEELDYKGLQHEYNSTAQLLRHLAFVDLEWVYRINGETMPESLRSKYGPMLDENHQLPYVFGISLDQLLSNYNDIFHMFTTTCVELTDLDLDKIVHYENGKEATIRWGIWHMADHNRYHQAHMNQLRKWFKEKKDRVFAK